jgi:hypothetical protein
MAEERKKDGEPWTPKLDSNPLFTNSADFERRLGEDEKTPDIDIVDEGEPDDAQDITPNPGNPFIRPSR